MQRLILLTLFLSSTLLAFEWNTRGQASLWNNSTMDELKKTQIGLRYIPELSMARSFTAGTMLDAEISYNGFANFNFDGNQSDTNLSPYRIWLRYSGSQFEARLGLQQIKFGPAMVLRPLMWFDQLDPRDPLQFTKGVTGGLMRYYFLNNANIWVWGLVANDDTRGMEIIPSEKKSFEFGGRAQYPIGPGELAFSYHHRNGDPNPLLRGMLVVTLDPVPENRYALDGKWDAGIGLWFESVLVHKKVDYFPINYQKYLTVGADYTFALGNGLHVLGEHMMLNTSNEFNNVDDRTELTALLADYSITLWDMVMGIVYIDWTTNDSYKFLTWRRTYDNWSFNAAFYWNPDTPSMGGLRGRASSSAGAGKGFQLMVIFNH